MTDLGTRPTTVAVVGAGGFAGFILDAVRDVPEAHVAAVVDIDRTRARELAARHGARELSWNEALADPAVDAVVIASPPGTHSALAIEAIGAGKDVFCEKPVGTTPSEALAVRNHAAKHDRVVVVDHVLRYNPLLRGLRRLQDHLDWRPVRFLFEN
ncbi:MAG TPA: Gfo/Idh/MocA family oxidoreductase, partial [Acidimicrobiales bacterium]|nr:Gfo/Idh/MocA family oxidoreductase [Acidimicrobiales bacterium]